MTTSPRGKGSIDRDGFAAEAVERLREAIAEVEALAQAAAVMGDGLPWLAEAGHRRAVGRMQNIVFMIAERAEMALDEAERMVTGLARRPRKPLG